MSVSHSQDLEVPRAAEGYGWPSIPAELQHLPVFVVDVDGTVRGEVIPMIKLAAPLVPNFLAKIAFREPWNASKSIYFFWNLLKLWTLRTVYGEQRRRYKHLFSELHHLASTLLKKSDIETVRERYRARLPLIGDLWAPAAVELLRRASQHGVVILVTGSEQIQTEECVFLLAKQGVNVSRVFVHGSLYGVDLELGQYTGKVNHLNITLDAKRDVLQRCRADATLRFAAAFGNSRPDRALFEVVEAAGLCALVCPEPVVRRRKERNFVLRKYLKNGYRICWEVGDYLSAVEKCRESQGDEKRPILITDRHFANVIDDPDMLEAFGYLLRPEPFS